MNGDISMSRNNLKKTTTTVVITGVLLASVTAMAAGGDTIGSIATNIKGTFSAIASMIMGMSYVAGIGFFVGAIFKFKQHKDNPTQIPMGTPIALLMIAVCLVFMPYIITSTGSTLTGKAANKGIGGTSGVLPGAGTTTPAAGDDDDG